MREKPQYYDLAGKAGIATSCNGNPKYLVEVSTLVSAITTKVTHRMLYLYVLITCISLAFFVILKQPEPTTFHGDISIFRKNLVGFDEYFMAI